MAELIVVGGANGSGKTTFAEEFVTNNTTFEYIGADAIAYELAPHDVQSVRISAGRLFIKRVVRAIQEQRNIIIESTLSGITFQRIINSANKENYNTTAVYLYLEDVNLCVHRVHERVLKGGHDVPIEDIIRRYGRSCKLFWESYRYLFDSWIIYRNANNEFDMIAEGDRNNYTILHEVILEKFINTIKKGH